MLVATVFDALAGTQPVSRLVATALSLTTLVWQVWEPRTQDEYPRSVGAG